MLSRSFINWKRDLEDSLERGYGQPATMVVRCRERRKARGEEYLSRRELHHRAGGVGGGATPGCCAKS
jgi:hypothetical protein